MIVRVAKVAEALGNGLQTWTLRLVPKCVVGIGAVDDLAQQHQGGVAGQVVLLQDRLERTLLAVVAQLDVFDVKGNGAQALRLGHDLIGRDEEKLGVRVDEFLDQPGTCHTVDFDGLV